MGSLLWFAGLALCGAAGGMLREDPVLAIFLLVAGILIWSHALAT